MNFRIEVSDCARRLSVLLALSALAVGLSSCGGSGSDGGLASATDTPLVETTTGSIAETETGESDAPADGSSADDSSADDSTDVSGDADGSGEEAGNDADDGSCIEGDWTVTEEELSAYYAALGASTGVPMTATGTMRIRFIDLQYHYDAVFQLEMDLEGMSATATADGLATGSYVIEDGVISTELTANSMNILVNVGGIEIDGSDLGNDFLTSSPINDAPYSCDGPTISFETAGAPHPVKLTPYEG